MKHNSYVLHKLISWRRIHQLPFLFDLFRSLPEFSSACSSLPSYSTTSLDHIISVVERFQADNDHRNSDWKCVEPTDGQVTGEPDGVLLDLVDDMTVSMELSELFIS